MLGLVEVGSQLLYYEIDILLYLFLSAIFINIDSYFSKALHKNINDWKKVQPNFLAQAD